MKWISHGLEKSKISLTTGDECSKRRFVMETESVAKLLAYAHSEEPVSEVSFSDEDQGGAHSCKNKRVDC